MPEPSIVPVPLTVTAEHLDDLIAVIVGFTDGVPVGVGLGLGLHVPNRARRRT